MPTWYDRKPYIQFKLKNEMADRPKTASNDLFRSGRCQTRIIT